VGAIIRVDEAGVGRSPVATKGGKISEGLSSGNIQEWEGMVDDVGGVGAVWAVKYCHLTTLQVQDIVI